jgi:hypothetical protein
MSRSFAIVALGLLIEGAAGSCVQIDGGAIEVSWALYANGRAVTDCSCSDPTIVSFRLDVTGKGGAIDGAKPCAGRPECVFSCQRQTGATPFDIPETHGDETYQIGIVAVDKDGVDLKDGAGMLIQAPTAQISRTVVRGQPTEVEALAVEVTCAAACDGMNKVGVCARP